MGHDFYKVANEIIENPSVDLKLTIDGDDIYVNLVKSITNMC